MIVRSADAALEQITRARAAIGEVVFGRSRSSRIRSSRCWPAAMAFWSACPGLAKTKLVDTMGSVLGLDTVASSSRRI